MKIKYLIDTILSPKIQPLDFVDRYAGIVRTINIAEGNGTETGIIKRYPLACDVTGVDCANVGIYQNLVPDDTKKSVIYWEMISPMTNIGMTKTRDFYRKKFRGTARLVVWLNLAKLGIDNCTDSILVLPVLEKEITTKGKITGGIYDGDLLWIEPLRMVNQDINTIFGKYDYNKLKNYYLYPFDFFAIDVQFTLEQCLSKGGAGLPCSVPLDCPNEGPVECKSLQLDGVNEYINCGNNTAFDLSSTQGFTLSATFKKLGGVYLPIFQKLETISNLNVTGYRLYISPLNEIVFNLIGGSTLNRLTVFSPPILDNTWYTVLLTYDGSEQAAGVKIYVNGILQPLTIFTDNYTGSLINTQVLTLGGQPTPLNPLYGFCNYSDAKIWNVELTETEVQNYLNCITNVPNESALILNTNIGGSAWTGTAYHIPDLTTITTGYTSVNSEENDLVNDCP